MEHQSNTYAGPRQEAQFDLKRFIAIIIRRRWLILAIALPIIFMVTFGTMKTSSSVTAGTLIMVETRQPENPFFSQRVVNDDVVMSTAAQIGMSIPVAEKAAVLLADSIPVLRDEDPLLIDLEEGEDLVGRLIESVDCGPVGESNVLNLTFTHPSPRFALAAVTALSEGFVQFNIERQQNPSAVSYYTDQIRQVQAEVDSIMKLKSEVLDDAGMVAFSNSAQGTILHIRTMEQELFRVRSARRGIEGRLDKLKDTIAQDPEYYPSDERFVMLKVNYETLLAELSKLRAKYKDDSVWVQRQYELISDASASLKRERDAYIAELEIELADVIAKEEAFLEAVETQSASLDVYPQVLRRTESFDLQINSRRDLLESLQMKRGEVRLKAGSDQRISSLVQLNQPTISSRIGGSKKLLYIGVAVVFSLILGLIVAIFVDNQDHRIYDRRQASQMLDVPVLGALSSPGKK
jgi:uncharacterized protein involved in exopolysaccharide biosynthesis